MLAKNRYICLAGSSGAVSATQQPKSFKTDLASLLCLAMLPAPTGCPFLSPSSPNPPKRTSPVSFAWLCSLLSLWWSVSAAGQPKSFKTDLASLLYLAVLPAPAGGPFWPLSSPNPSKRTSPASSAWPCSLLSLWWSVSAAGQPKSFKTDLASLLCLAVLPAPAGGPFWPLSSPNPSKRTSPACYAGACSLSKSSKTDLARTFVMPYDASVSLSQKLSLGDAGIAEVTGSLCAVNVAHAEAFDPRDEKR